jgi:hypothetical protein
MFLSKTIKTALAYKILMKLFFVFKNAQNSPPPAPVTRILFPSRLKFIFYKSKLSENFEHFTLLNVKTAARSNAK